MNKNQYLKSIHELTVDACDIECARNKTERTYIDEVFPTLMERINLILANDMSNNTTGGSIVNIYAEIRDVLCEIDNHGVSYLRVLLDRQFDMVKGLYIEHEIKEYKCNHDGIYERGSTYFIKIGLGDGVGQMTTCLDYDENCKYVKNYEVCQTHDYCGKCPYL